MNYPVQYQRVTEQLGRDKLDAVLAISMENVYWLSEVMITTQKSIPDRLAIVVAVDGEAPSFVVCSIEESLVVQDSWIDDVVTYEEFTDCPIQVCVDVLKERGLRRGRIGIEKRFVCANDYEKLMSLLPDVDWVDFSPGFDRLRMIKTPREIEIMQHAARSTETAMMDAFSRGKAGETEKKVMNEMIMSVLEAGADGAKGTFGSGPKSAIAHPFADNTHLVPGALVSVDFGGCFSGYYSDLGRTAVVGSPSDRQSKIYQVIYDVQRRLIDMAKVGVKARDLYVSAIEQLQGKGLDLSLPHVGHGLGLSLHEEPLLNPHNDMRLTENMVICIEPFYVTDEGYHAEDTVWITEDGAVPLSDVADHSSIICIGR